MRSRILFWAPRALAVLFALFLGMFALDVFSEGAGAFDMVVALGVHLVPALLVLIVLALAWRREAIGVAGFVALGAAYVVVAWGRFPLATYVVITGPLLLLALLFALSWRDRLHAGTGQSAG
ncbi:MAG: hypothetical protein KBD01_17700 [Acidobacteria bacterium]|nr:hypothetical protein [Acidobacteriota bacterium]